MTFVVMHSIDQERKRQDTKWGEQNHSDEIWLAILMEEIGEVAKAMLAGQDAHDPDAIKQELVQVAAVSVAWLECMKRRRVWFD